MHCAARLPFIYSCLSEHPILDRPTDRVPDAEIVLTLREKGVAYGSENDRINHRAYQVEAVDTFTGYYIGFLSQDKTVEESLHIASRAAALAVTKPGAGDSIPHMKEVKQWM